MSVPSEYQTLVDRLRRFIKDEEDINTLLEAEENTDQFLYECIQDSVQEINWTYKPTTTYSLSNISFDAEDDGIPWIMVKDGAILKFLTGAGIHSARNTFTYSDGSGIQTNDTDVWGRYINYYNVLVNKHKEMVKNFKLDKNLDDCYSGVHSEYNNLW